MSETITVAGDNLTLDLILWRRYGLRGQELIEKTMALNPDLTFPFLPVGSNVVIPELPPQVRATRRVVTLFG